MPLIYKICSEALWREAEQKGVFEGAPVDLQDGFIHFSTAEQLAETAEKHFRGQGGLLLISVEETALGAALKYEPSRGGNLFPHLYGPLRLDAVRQMEPLGLDAGGGVVLPRRMTERPGPFDPVAEGWRDRPQSGFMALLGSVWVKEQDGQEMFGFLAEARHLNQGGVVHGGMLMAFADQALGMAASRVHGGRRQVTIQLDTHFLSGVREGEFVVARCSVVRQTRSLMFMTCTLLVGERAVTTASGVWKLLGA